MIHVFFIFIFILFLSSFAKQETLILKDLSSTNYSTFNDTMTNKSLAVLFQPGCSSCTKQIKNLDCLKKITSKIVLVGSLDNENKVRRSYLKKKSSFKGYYVSQNNLSQLGFEQNIAPQTIYYSFKGRLKFTGYRSCKKIKTKIEEFHGNS